MQANELRILVTIAILLGVSSACGGQRGAPPATDQLPERSVESSKDPHEGHVKHDHSQHVLPATAALATDSVYHSGAQLTDQEGRPFELSSLRGSAVLAAMFYASCTSVCPVLIARLEQLVTELPTETRAQTHVLLVSLDPQHDDTEKLKQLAQRHNIVDPHWHFVRTDENGTREVAALLGVRYRLLPDGEISHSQVITLLDQNGVAVERMENAADNASQLVAALTQTVQGKGAGLK